MKTVIQFPTRGRGTHKKTEIDGGNHNFFDVLELYDKYREDVDNTHIRVICDTDDSTMNNDVSVSRLERVDNLSYHFDDNNTKIEACNRRAGDDDYDIIVLASDDMIPQVSGYDEVIKSHMNQHFQDTDGALWYYDGFKRSLCTLSILGKKYYNRFGYIYHPDYRSFYCDDEYTRVGQQLKKIKFINQVIIRHDHPTFKRRPGGEDGVVIDETYIKNNKDIQHDKDVYYRRIRNNFK
jgi:hypothetical protein